MVKKKGKSKRTTLKDKYKMQKRVLETNRKRRKEAKKNPKANHGKRDPGIPNSWPFKQDLLKEIQKSREKVAAKEQLAKTQRKEQLLKLREHQNQGGTARTVQELMDQAQAKQHQRAIGSTSTDTMTETKTTTTMAMADASDVPQGQQSRRAFFKELYKVIDTADVLLQVLDARDPSSTRLSSAIENKILSSSDKKMVLVLNKIDLVPREVVGSWLTTLRRSHPTIAMSTTAKETSTKEVSSSKSKSNSNSSVASTTTTTTASIGAEGLLQLLKNYARTSGDNSKKRKTTIVVGVIGYPNVGKSSIINALKRTRAVGVSSKPGFTTTMQEVVLDRNVRLLDSPGVVFDDASALLGNCVDAASMEDPVPAVEALLQRCDHDSLIMTYCIPAFSSTEMFLSLVAKKLGRVLKGGIPDKMAAARLVLKDWNTGKIKFYTVPPVTSNDGNDDDDDEDNANRAAAVVVSQFGKEFDIAKFDQQVFSSLDGGGGPDEMDFVKLQAANPKHDDDDDDSDEDVESMQEDDEDDDDDDDDMVHTRKAVASAPDYDFDAM